MIHKSWKEQLFAKSLTLPIRVWRRAASNQLDPGIEWRYGLTNSLTCLAE